MSQNLQTPPSSGNHLTTEKEILDGLREMGVKLHRVSSPAIQIGGVTRELKSFAISSAQSVFDHAADQEWTDVAFWELVHVCVMDENHIPMDRYKIRMVGWKDSTI